MTTTEVLLAVHTSYLKPVTTLMKSVTIRGMAHITGGGFPDNVPRVLPPDVNAVFDRASWKVPELFQFIQATGKVDREEMYRVFNMGVGMVVIVRKADVDASLAVLRKAGARPVLIGWVEKGARQVRLIN